MALPNDTALRLIALSAALAALTVEDIEAVKAEGTLGPDVAANIQKLQDDAGKFDDESIAALNQQGKVDQLPPV